MDIQEYIDEKIEIYNLLLEFIDSENYDSQAFQRLIDYLNDQKIHENRAELKSFLRLILIISKHHHRNHEFFSKIDKIINHYETEIKQTFSNFELFNLFKRNKRILLFLIQKKTIEFDESIINYIYEQTDFKYKQFRLYFSPELKTVINDTYKTKFENEISNLNSSILDDFEENRQIGENETYICKLIRNDSVQEFIAYVNKELISFNSTIKPSIYETNSLLLKNGSSLIEYAAFFGSIQIFRFLKMSHVKLCPSLWIYAIHGKNADIIHLLEEAHVEPYDKTYNECLKESIKCHHNDFANYFKEGFVNQNCDENIIDYGFHYYNYEYFTNDGFNNNNLIFNYSCKYEVERIFPMFSCELFERNVEISSEK